MLTKINNVYRLKNLVKFSRCVWTVSTKENNVLSLKNDQQYEMKFPFVWLRDNCRCSQCFHKDSNSRTIHIQKFNFKAVPVKTNVNDKQLEIEWDDNHKSNFLLPWLKERQFTSEAQNKWRQKIFKDTKITWTTEEYPKILKKIFFDKILESDKELLSWLESLSIYGVALIENAGAKDGTVEKLAEKVAFTKKTQYGNTFKVEAKPGTTNVAYLNAPLQLHTDLPYYHYKPGINLLHCIVQGEGGESQLADSFAIAKELKENNYAIYSILKETNIVWSDQCYEDGRNYHSINISPVICEDNDGEIERINFSQPQRDSQLNVPLEKVQPWYDALQVFSQMMYSKKFMIQYQMKPGEIITFDNLRLVHGRADYNGHRCVEGAYLDWDHIYSRIRVLRSKLKRM